MDPENIELEDTSPRADLEAAFAQHEESNEQAGGQDEGTPEPVRATEERPEPSVEGEPAPDAGKPAVAKADTPGTEPPKPTETDPNVATEVKAPAGWKAQAKAEWSKIPRAAQEEISRRETETAKALAHSTNARKHWDEFNQTVAPFVPLIRAQNSTPMAAVKNLMTTAAGLTVGSPEQKCRIIAEIIGNYGIDVALLDDIMSQNPPVAGRGAPGTSPTEVAIQRAMAPVFDFMNRTQQMQQQRAQQIQQDADMEVNAFAEKNEFFDDVREEVADVLEWNANRGRSMSLQQAYDFVVKNNPEISGILAQREAAQKSKVNGAAVQRARQAASSISGSPNLGVRPVSESNSRRSDIEAAWDEVSGR